MLELEAPPMAAWIIVVINCVLFLAFGVFCILRPARVAEAVDIQLPSPSAAADLRAMYGGLSLAIGLLMLGGLLDRAWFEPSLFLVVLTSAGMGSARLYSIVMSGVPNGLVLVGGLLAEVISFTWALWAYRMLDALA